MKKNSFLRSFLIFYVIGTCIAVAVIFGRSPKAVHHALPPLTTMSTLGTTTTFVPETTTVIVTTTTSKRIHTIPKTPVTHTQVNQVSRSNPGGRINWDAMATCESHNNWAANTGNGFYGGLQFTHTTWINAGGGKYAQNANLTSRENQIAVASTLSLSNWPVCKKYAYT
jgi:hypothetical protein